MKPQKRFLALVLIASLLFSLLPDTALAAALKITTIKDISASVYVNQSYSLPATVKASMSDKTTRKVTVTWKPATADTSKTGTYTFKGTVKNYSKQVLLTLKVTAAPSYTDPELARAVSLGIGNYADNKTVTYKQFFSMLDSAVKLSNPKVYQEWVKDFSQARTSENTMKREEGMLAVYFAAEALGPDYYNPDAEWWLTDEKIGRSNRGLTWNYPLFPNWDKPSLQWKGMDQWDNHITAAYFYSMGKVSKYSNATIFDYDANKNSMRPTEPFTYEEALRAAVRLYYSGLQVTDRIPSEDDTKLLNQADQRRNAIRNSKTAVKITGTAYYVSNSGNDNNDGLTPETAWATIAKVNSKEFNPGDGIYFERGGLWREIPRYRDNITYSAYGEGPKPKIYGSPENGAAPEKWKLLDGTNNIWVFYKDMYDTGCIVFDDGKSWATRKNEFWNGSRYVELLDNSKPIDPSNLDNLHFLSSPDYTGYSSKEAALALDKKGKLYLRCDAGNPGSVYHSIEFLSNPMLNANGGEYALIHVGANSVVDNLCVMYGNQGGIALTGYDSQAGGNSVVQNCEVAWVGGCIVWFNASSFLGRDQNAAIRAGDGIGIAGGSDNIVTGNYVHHTYDNGLIEETGPWYNDKERFAKNNTYKGNLVEYCSGGVCIADWASVHTENYNNPLYDDFLIEDNYIMYTGYGWSHQGVDEDWGQTNALPNMGNSSIYFAFPPKSCTNINVINNVFYLSKYALVDGREKILPGKNVAQNYDVNFSGNTYVQNTLGLLATWGIGKDESISQKYYYDLFTQKTVIGVLGDKTGKVLPTDK